ncbi:hypothetical protein J2S09_001323 [Bacillus fengqiuensis]|nr:hypothetical protein [Bacillus fengqiuensis]
MRAMKEVWTPLKMFGVRYYRDRDQDVYYKKVGNRNRKQTRPFWKYKRFVLTVIFLLLAIPGGYAGYQIALDKASDKLVNEVASQVSKEDMNKLLEEPSVQEVLEKELGTKKAAALLKENNVDPAAIATARISSEDLTFKPTEGETAAGQAPSPTVQEPNKATAVEQGQGNGKTGEAASDPQTGQTPPTTENASASKEEKPKPRFQSREEATQFVMSKFSMGEISQFAQMAQGGLTEEEKSSIKSQVTSRLTAEEYEALKLFGIIELGKQQ